MRRWNRKWGVAAVLLVALAACGVGGPPAQAPASTPAVVERTAAPSTIAAATAAPAATPDQPAWTVIGLKAVSSYTYAHIPQSKTREGYYVLGKPDAPVLLQFYSDFL
jgi:predicted small lipoprotein YifL